MNEITVSELQQWKEEGKEFQLIDVREPFEYEMSNLNGLNIPLASVILEAEKISKNIPVVLQCRSGARSAAALNQLEQNLGYTNLYNLKGGILAWAAEIDPEISVY
jgi:rhodanese-related sulfurtransferase